MSSGRSVSATDSGVRVEPALGRGRLYAIGLLTIAVAVALFFVPPIHQDQAYHVFADQRAMFAVSNFLNVASNLPFLLVGVLGLLFVLGRGRVSFVDQSERWAYAALFLGVALTCFGSGYYHAAPSDERLVWDRLPMTLAFMSFFAATISERINVKAGRALLVPLLVAGTGSVVYWNITGDLRPYVAVQFYPLLAIPLMCLLFHPRYTRSADIAGVIAFYGAAKFFELLDRQIYALAQIVSGHTVKHLSAAAATYLILRMLRRRHPASLSAQPCPLERGIG